MSDLTDRLREFHPDVDDYPGREAADVLDAIDALHQPEVDPDMPDMNWCHSCDTLEPWPCPTHKLLHPEEEQ